ncbi:MAG: rhombotarget lipoprotein [Gammaproteobacteria bacterium]|nr:rhombotarget lipoprotein [Gammaproteobacteria bacterium]
MILNNARRLLAFALIGALPGCSAAFYGGTERSTSSSMVDYLYPEGERPVVNPEITPRLELPLRVGIAFVPTTKRSWRGGLEPTEARRIELLAMVKSAFEGVDYVEDIQIIPSNYLASAGGFSALEQTSRLYDLDVFALVSWDQVVNTEDSVFSILYWTIVGGYVIPASENSVHTMLDTAVFDIRTRKLLLRAPGFDHASRPTTAIASETGQKRISDLSFENAIGEMSKNLEAEIGKFGKRVKADKSVEIAYSRNYKGSWVPVQVLVGLALAVLWVPRRIRRSPSRG